MFLFWVIEATAVNTHLVVGEPGLSRGGPDPQGTLGPEHRALQGFTTQHCFPRLWHSPSLSCGSPGPSHRFCTRSLGLADSGPGGACSQHPSSGAGPFQPRRPAPHPLSAPCVSSLVKQQRCSPWPGRSVGFFQNVRAIMNRFLCKKVLKPTLKRY